MQNVFGVENKVKKKKKREWVSKCKLKVISVFRFLTPALFFLVVGTYYTILGRRLFSTCDLSPSNSLQIIVSALPADTLPEARATKPAGTVPSLLSRYFFLHRKKKEKKDEVGQSGVLPFPAADRAFPVFFGDESSGVLKVRIKALFPIREVTHEAQLGVESVLRAGGVHGFRPPLCRKGRVFGFSKSQFLWMSVVEWRAAHFSLEMRNAKLSWGFWHWLARLAESPRCYSSREATV